MAYDTILVEQKGRVTWITLNRPAQMNAITHAMHDELQAAFDAFAADDDQWICVVTGAGEKAFCAGTDLKEAASSSTRHAYPKNGYAGLIERFDLNKPVIAAVNGLALGGGFEVALACDLIIASENARFGLPEPLVGAVALGGGLHRLARQIGLKKAMGYIFTGRQMSAADAEQMGLVNEVVPADQLEQAVHAWCEDMLRCAPISIRASKETVMSGLEAGGVEAAMKAQPSMPGFVEWTKAEDTREGPLAFAEKRKPNWKGR